MNGLGAPAIDADAENVGGVLLVPIHLDALFVRALARGTHTRPLAREQAAEESVLGPLVDFSRLPYFDGEIDRHPHVPYISGEIAPRPFQDQSRRLEPGVHLHWALPDALTRGVNTREGIVFPLVPDRWLVTRTLDGEIEQWVVESDHLFPESPAEGPEPGAGSISFPTPPKLMGPHSQPYRYMGRKLSLESWLRARKEEDATYLNRCTDKGFAGLTALGYGEPEFAAFYPNCHSVFGLWDRDVTDERQFKQVSYDVIGWYDRAAQDCLWAASLEQTSQAIRKRLEREFEESGYAPDVTDLEVRYEGLEHLYRWNVSDKAAPFPRRVVCYSSLTVKAHEVREDPIRQSGTIEVAVGNTGTEALSAYLADKLPWSKSVVEEQLEAFDLAHRLGHRQLDIGPKFQEARHDKGFRAIRGGTLWTVRAERRATEGAPASAEGAAEAHRAVELRVETAHALNRLNTAQVEWDRAQFEIESMRHQLYNDWSIFMLACHTPRAQSTDLPDPDRAAWFIEKTGIVPLERKLSETGRWEPLADELGAIVEAETTEDSAETSLAGRVVASIREVVKQIAVENERLGALETDAGLRYALRQLVGPRFWRPTAPSLLLIGDAVRPTMRHGTDGPLACKTLALDGEVDMSFLDHVRAEIVAEVPDGDQIGARVWRHQPWHPFLLEWQVEVYPQRRHGTQHPDRRAYGHEFVTGNYALPETRVQLEPQPKGIAIAKTSDISVYSGRCVLTDYTPLLLKDRLQDYLSKNGFAVVRGIIEGGRIGNKILGLLQKSSMEDQESSITHLAGIGVGQVTAEKITVAHAAAPLESLEDLDHLLTTLGAAGDRAFAALLVHARSQLKPAQRTEATETVHGLPTGGAIDRAIVELVRGTSADDLHAQAGVAKLTADKIVEESGKVSSLKDLDALPSVGSRTLLRLFHQAIRSRRVTFAQVAQESLGISDPILTAAAAIEQLALQPNLLVQALDGFNEALLQGYKTLQLPIKDPCGFADLKPLTDAVAALTQGHNTSSPLPGNDFIPIRSGQMKIDRLRLVDTFGRVRPVEDTSHPITTELMRTPANRHLVSLPPRLVQPARISFRWLSAEPSPDTDRDEPEMNDHPAYTPVCGWVLPNALDSSLMVYANTGTALGSLVKKGGAVEWEPAPGADPSDAPCSHVDEIPNPHLGRMVKHIQQQGWDYLYHFLSTLDRALVTIAPESFSAHESLALLMGRPVAVVRATLDLELCGHPAVNHDPYAFWEDMLRDPKFREPDRTKRTHDEFTQVRFPVRIGEYQQLNDGLVGYWVEDEGRYRDDIFYAPQAGASEPLKEDLEEDLTVELDQGFAPPAVLAKLEPPAERARITIETPGHRWRIDTPGGVYTAVWAEPKLAITRILPSSFAPRIQTHWKEPINLSLSIDQPLQKLTMLVDPQGSVHAVTGILPTKAIDIPPQQYAEALRRIEISFHTTPILTQQGALALPLPKEPGYHWSWLTKENGDWIHKDAVFAPIDPSAHFEGRQRIVEGWLKLNKIGAKLKLNRDERKVEPETR